MGFPFEELITYFFPSNISIEEFRFGYRWNYLNFSKIRNGEIHESMIAMPECLRNNIIEIATKWEFFLENRKLFFENRKQRSKEKVKFEWPFLGRLPMLNFNDRFRCGRPLLNPKSVCNTYDIKNEGVWGSK